MKNRKIKVSRSFSSFGGDEKIIIQVQGRNSWSEGTEWLWRELGKITIDTSDGRFAIEVQRVDEAETGPVEVSIR